MNLYNIDQTIAGKKPFQLYDKKKKEKKKGKKRSMKEPKNYE